MNAMAPRPPHKRRKLQAPAKPIIFESPGLEQDARLNVLGTDFHVHSIILKLHSAFFRKFLDSPDKQPAPASAPFRYEYSSVLDLDSSSCIQWVLEPGRKDHPPDVELDKASINIGEEIVSFNRLLCAMYNRPWSLNTVAELESLTNFAEYYCALPIVSATLSGALVESEVFFVNLEDFSPDESLELQLMLKLAMKLRHSTLFRDTFVYIVGLWPYITDKSEIETYPQVVQLVSREHESIYQLLLEVQNCLWKLPDYFTTIQNIAKRDVQHCSNPMQTPSFYQTLARVIRMCHQEPDELDVQDLLERLLRNCLTLYHSSRCVGELPFEHIFLCAGITDEEMPWDKDAIDW